MRLPLTISLSDALPYKAAPPALSHSNDEGDLHADHEKWLEKLSPEEPYSQYAHNGFKVNADAHLKRTLMGRKVVAAP